MRFPVALQQLQHLTRICETCKHLKIHEGCSWPRCDHFSSKERYWDAVERGECPAKRFDIFKDES